MNMLKLNEGSDLWPLTPKLKWLCPIKAEEKKSDSRRIKTIWIAIYHVGSSAPEAIDKATPISVMKSAHVVPSHSSRTAHSCSTFSANFETVTANPNQIKSSIKVKRINYLRWIKVNKMVQRASSLLDTLTAPTWR